MDTIFQLPLLTLALLQILISLLLLAPKAVSLPLAQLLRKASKNAAANSTFITVSVVLGGLMVSCVLELYKNYERAIKADVREVVSTVDYLRAQVSSVLCALNLLLLFLCRALSEATCVADQRAKSLDALQRQTKGLQAEYMRVTSAPKPSGAAGGEDKAGSGVPGEVEALKKQVDRLIGDKDTLQMAAEAAQKAKATAEASVVAMKSQLKGFDAQFDRILEENKLLKRKLVGYGDKTYAGDVTQQHGSSAKDD